MTPRQDAPPIPYLDAYHRNVLEQGSGLSPAIIRERGYRSTTGPKELRALGFNPAQQRLLMGILVPIHPPGQGVPLIAFRPDHPRLLGKAKRMAKYELPAGTIARLDVPPRCKPAVADPTAELWITEGAKKADALADRGIAALALLGVWNFRGTHADGGKALLADFDVISWQDRRVVIAFDSDAEEKDGVWHARDRLTHILRNFKASVAHAQLPPGPDGAKQGVDDYLLTHTPDELRALAVRPSVEAPPPRVSAPTAELLLDPPPELRRPLDLVGGAAYAVAWPHVRVTITEAVETGKLRRHDPPLVKDAPAMHVLRGDGATFGPTALPLSGLGMAVEVPDLVHPSAGWSARGLIAYKEGARPEPADVLARLTAVYDHYIDFGMSLGSQDDMSALSACFSLQTWFTPAFTVLGYPWVGGESGSAKTKWGTCWAMTSYLGLVTTAGSTFASLRDLADAGATLLFDDAEVFADPKRSDPEKRELLLAGNRRGAIITLKEPTSDGRWRFRHVNAFCPRGFAAIRVPDPVLASRSVRIPLVRSADAARVNRDPAKVETWPRDRRALLDDLWALALWLLPEAAAIWTELDTETGAVGREFEPWRALVAVARLLDRHGVSGMESRVRALMETARKERRDSPDRSWAVQVVQAIQVLVTKADANRAGADAPKVVQFSVLDVLTELGNEGGGDDGEGGAGWANARRVGRILTSLRIPQEPGRAKGRVRTLSRAALASLVRAHGLEETATATTAKTVNEQKPSTPVANVPHVLDVPNVLPTPPLNGSDTEAWRCFSCGGTEWWGTPDHRVCVVCHPDPSAPRTEGAGGRHGRVVFADLLDDAPTADAGEAQTAPPEGR